MDKICIAGNELLVKDYHCMQCGSFFKPLENESYLPKEETKLWLYVNVTDRCPAGCPFCVSSSAGERGGLVDPNLFGRTLEKIRAYVSGVSFTGGEPMLHPALLDELVGITDSLVGSNTGIEMVTNGTNMGAIPEMKHIDRVTTIHISRHHDSDDINRSLMQWNAPGVDDIRRLMANLRNSGRVVFNCVLQKGGIETAKDIKRYLDHAIALGVRNNSFITMFQANEYCQNHFVSAFSLPFVSDLGCSALNFGDDSSFDVWNRHRDHSSCCCMSGGYHTKEGKTRFYFRCPGEDSGVAYCRQLVYTAENILQDGFGAGRIVLVE